MSLVRKPRTRTVPGPSMPAPDTCVQVSRETSARPRWPGARGSGGLLSGELLVNLRVPGPGGGHDVGRDLRARRRAVPVQAAGPVAQELLVERVLRPPRLPVRRTPEPRRVRG